MPELPEVAAISTWCQSNIVGRRIRRIDLGAISLLKSAFDLETLVGCEVSDSLWRAKYICWELSGGGASQWMVMHLSRGGWLHPREKSRSAKLSRSPLALRISFDDERAMDLTEAGKEKRAALWVVEQIDQVDRVHNLGPDALSEEMNRQVFGGLLAAAGAMTLKVALTDQQLIGGIGNAFSDEILWRAKLSPFKPCNKLTEEEQDEVFEAMVNVLSEAFDVLVELDPDEMKRAKKALLRVHGRTGKKCVACGDVIASVDRGSSTLEYCPRCQTGGKQLANRRLSRLLR